MSHNDISKDNSIRWNERFEMEQRSEIEFKKPVFDGVQHTLTMESGQKVIL